MLYSVRPTDCATLLPAGTAQLQRRSQHLSYCASSDVTGSKNGKCTRERARNEQVKSAKHRIVQVSKYTTSVPFISSKLETSLHCAFSRPVKTNYKCFTALVQKTFRRILYAKKKSFSIAVRLCRSNMYSSPQQCSLQKLLCSNTHFAIPSSFLLHKFQQRSANVCCAQTSQRKR